ncbi:hypothetical protein CAL65_09710 [Alkalilimnicola ehrlichii]|uniref:Replication initiation protein n=2 Tax=Alkalilimnicola ehrlichii TaxID=351052 RepID=A0A3E0WVD1_9GAMM|nr:hypothetical protein CAL65_09710 [Alkalilimnicola ehrlichii]
MAFTLFGSVHAGNDLLILFESNAASESIGTTNNGRLVNGKRLPSSGPNFRTYSRLGSLIGRTAVHDRVRDTVLGAYRQLAEEHPELVFVYGETGWPWGGRFRPHRTHQNGLSVDFMVPVRKDARSVPLPTHPFNKWGYAISFDREGRSGELQIDFEAIAAHLHALIAAGREHGVGIELVVFAPDLQQHLFDTESGAELRDKIRFNVNPSWVRHDDHYHVDFRLER